MKRLLLLLFLSPSISIFSQAQKGYAINVTLKPFKNQFIYLGYYSGNQYPVVDSVRLNALGQATFKGPNALPGGIYIIGYPSRDRFTEILIDKQQHFSLYFDTADINKKKFTGSTDNDQFNSFQLQMVRRGKGLDSMNRALALARTASDSAKWLERGRKLNADIAVTKKNILSKNPNSFLSTLMYLLDEPAVPPATQQPGGKYDSTFAYRYFKDHYWDGINFYDDRITRTPAALFEQRLDKYYNTLVYPSADSVIKELDYMLGFASGNKVMTQFLLAKFITRYLNMKYMWEDAVYVHLYQKYFADKEYDWLTPQGKRIITERAFNLMANILGNHAEDIALPDSTGKIRMLFADSSKFTLVCFWDPTCGHCKETLPKLDSMFRAKWRDQGLKIYAVAKETDGTRKDWLDFISQNHLEGWTNVYYSRADDKMRTDAGIPGYSQLYDAQTVPAIFLLDRQKRIVAKKMSWEQVDEVIRIKAAQQ